MGGILKLARISVLSAVCMGGCLPYARALVTFNDGKDKVFVTGSVSFGWDSNLYAVKDGKGDYATISSIGTEYSRRAGLIGVDASAQLNMAAYKTLSRENYSDPKFSLEFTKETGRTTGSLLLSAERQSKADSAANVRSESWNYNANLNLRYPVIERYSLSGLAGYSRRDFIDNAQLYDSSTVTAGANLFYVYTSERDLMAGYRYREETSSISTTNTDHAFLVGVSGKILPKLNGSINAGYQYRVSELARREVFKSWTSTASATWNINKRLTATGQLSKDFNTTSTNLSTDSLTSSVSVTYAYSSKWSVTGAVGYGVNRFLGSEGEGRRDTFYTHSISLGYSRSDHLKVSLAYAFFHNWSTASFADFTREGYTLTITTRW